MKTLKLSAVLWVLAATAASEAQEVGDIQRGAALAREACGSCHAIQPDETASPVAAATSFERVANTPGMTTTAISVWLRTSHPTMPNIILSPEQIRDVAAYILNLRD